MTPIEKLTKLRDRYKKAGKLVEAKAVQRAIEVIKNCDGTCLVPKGMRLAEVQLDQ